MCVENSSKKACSLDLPISRVTTHISVRSKFSGNLMDYIAEYETCLSKVCSSNKSTYHLSEINRHNIHPYMGK
jgi:hypothetical protein